MLGKPHPEQDRVGGRPGPPGRARVVRPFPRVGRSIPRATGGPDEWLLPPPDGRGNRIRLTDLLRRLYLPGARAVLGRGCAAPCAPPTPPDPAPHAAKPRAASLPGARAVLGRGCAAPCAPPTPPDPAPHAAKPRAASLPGARAVLARYARCGPTLARLRRAPRTPRRTRQ